MTINGGRACLGGSIDEVDSRGSRQVFMWLGVSMFHPFLGLDMAGPVHLLTGFPDSGFHKAPSRDRCSIVFTQETYLMSLGNIDGARGMNAS